MKLLHRMLVAPMLAVGFLLATAVVSHVSLRSVADKFEVLRDERMRAAHDLAGMTLRMAQLNAQLYRTLILAESQGPEKMAEARKALEDETAALSSAAEGLMSRVPSDAAEPLRAVPALVGKYRSLAVQALTMAESTPGGGALMLGGAEKAFKAAFAAVAEVNRLVEADVDATAAQVLQVTQLATRSMAVMCVLAVAVSLIVALLSARRIVRRIEGAVQVSEAIARGELRPVHAEGVNDEVGRLLTSLSNTSTRLSESMLAIQEASGSINVAAAEIANGSMDLSQRTELTAGSLEDTKTALQEMGGLASQGSQAAQEARDLAKGASQLANSGGQVVTEVVQTMRDINDGSKRIADITNVIDGIAFQTNILALNAAVEAARAGEQGRGFAVVASEVRALAQRSASAAKEIKQLIGGSVERIEQGTGLADRAGQAMQQIVEAVRRVDEVIESVGQSTSRQDNGVKDVRVTLEQFDQMTQENAALSEQSAAASESLRQQAARLTEVTGRFKVASA